MPGFDSQENITSVVWLFFKRFLFSSRAGSVVRRISWISVVSLTVSVASLVVVMSVMKALNTNIQNKTLAVEPHLWLEVPGVKNADLLLIHPVTQRLKDYKVQLAETQDVIIRTIEGRFLGGVARGVSQEHLQDLLKQAKTSFYLKTDLSLEPGEVIIGGDLAIQLGALVGDTLLLLPPESLLLPLGEVPKFERVRIKEIVSTELRDIDAQSIFYVRQHTLNRLKNPSSLKLGLEVFLPDPYQAPALKQELSSFEGLRVETWQERNSALFLALRIEKFIIGTFLSIASVIAVFSLSSLILLLVSQKKKEIGILRAIGLSLKRVRNLFALIGALLGIFGLLGGLVLGAGLSAYLERYPLKVLPDIYYDSSIPAELDWKFIAVIFIFGLIIVSVQSILSVGSIKKLVMSEALRSKN